MGTGNAKKGNLIGLAVMAAASAALIVSADPLQGILKEILPQPPGVIQYKQVSAPAASRENGIVSADEWAAIYPEIVASYKANDENNYRIDYLEQDPYLKVIYECFGFAKDYTSAISHTYTLEDVEKHIVPTRWPTA